MAAKKTSRIWEVFFGGEESEDIFPVYHVTYPALRSTIKYKKPLMKCRLTRDFSHELDDITYVIVKSQIKP